MTSFQRVGLRRGLTFSGRRPQSANALESMYKVGFGMYVKAQRRPSTGKLVKAGRLKRGGRTKPKKPMVVTWSDLYKKGDTNRQVLSRINRKRAQSRAQSAPASRKFSKQYDVRAGADFNEANSPKNFKVTNSPKNFGRSPKNFGRNSTPGQHVTKLPTRTVQRKTVHASNAINQNNRAAANFKARKRFVSKSKYNLEPKDQGESEEENDYTLLRISKCGTPNSQQRSPTASPLFGSTSPQSRTYSESEPRITDLLKSHLSKTSIRSKCNGTSRAERPMSAAWIRKHSARKTKFGKWSKEMHKFQNDMWDPDADPEALNERGYGIGQWRMHEHFDPEMSESDEQLLTKANSDQWMRSNQSESKAKFKLVVGVPRTRSPDGSAWSNHYDNE